MSVESQFIDASVSQLRASLKMLRQTITDCSEACWLGGEHPRNFWRIAYHALYYTHLYCFQNVEAFVPWDKHRDVTDLWDNPKVLEPYTKAEILEYLDFIDANMAGWMRSLDLSSPESGYRWYPNMSKYEHIFVNLRHLSLHQGQLSELAFADGVEDIRWIRGVPSKAKA